MFKVVHSFVDVVEKRNYNVGDAFVIGPKTDAKRIQALSTHANGLTRPLIEKVEDPAPKPAAKKTKSANKGE